MMHETVSLVDGSHGCEDVCGEEPNGRKVRRGDLMASPFFMEVGFDTLDS